MPELIRSVGFDDEREYLSAEFRERTRDARLPTPGVEKMT